MEKDYLLTTLTVYKYNKKKIKCDYSCIPVTLNEEGNWKSGASQEEIIGEGFKKKDDYRVRYNKQKDGKSCRVELITVGDMEKDEDEAIKKIYDLFSKHFWYKFKYKKFLDKKKRLRQINF